MNSDEEFEGLDTEAFLAEVKQPKVQIMEDLRVG